MTTPTKTDRRLNLTPALPDQIDQNPPNESQNQKETSLEADAAPDALDTGAHLADYVVPDLEDDTEDEDAPVTIERAAELDAAAPPELIGKEAFFTVFKTAFYAPQFVLPDMAVLAVQPHEETAARGASDATYALLKIYYPAALSPKGEVFAHLMIAGPFFIGKALIVREALRARRAKPANPPQERTERPAEPPIGEVIHPAANANWPMDIEAVKMAATA